MILVVKGFSNVVVEK